MRRFTALLVSFLLLLQGLIPARADISAEQALPDFSFYSAQDGEKLSVNTQFAALGNTLSFAAFKFKAGYPNIKAEESQWQALYFEYKKAAVAEEKAVAEVYSYLNKTHKYGPRDAVSLAARPNGEHKICDGGKCFDETIYNLALLRFLLRYGAGLDETNKKWRWNREIMAEYAKPIYEVLNDYGAAPKDISSAQKYLRFLLEKTSDFCDNDIYLADVMPGLAGGSGRADASAGKERRKNYCEKLGYAALALALLENLSSADTDANAALIYEQLKKSYRKDYGAIVFGDYTTALLIIGSDKSFKLLENFLLKESLSDGLRVGSVWQFLGKALDVLSIKAWVDKFTDANNKIRGRGGRYLNEVGLRFQYIDKPCARAYGLGDFGISQAQNGQKGYNAPYGNLLEDIGDLIAQWPDNRAKNIARKAVSNYAFALKQGKAGYDYVHVPFVVGALKSGTLSSSDGYYVINKLYSLDWWDLNEGTQRRINNLAAKAAPKYNAGHKPEKTKDAVKLSRAAKNQKIEELTVWGDMLVSAVLITSFVTSIPSLARGAASFLKNFSAAKALRVARIRKAGKLDLLKKIHNSKPAPASTPKPAKPAAAAKGSAAPEPPKKQNSVASVVQKKKAADAPAPKNQPAANAASGQKTINISPETSPATAQVPFEEQTFSLTGQQFSAERTFSVSVGEGSSGAGAQGPARLTREQRLFRAQADAEHELRLAQEAMELSQPAAPAAPFKGGWFFNKPYKELPKWKQNIFNAYFAFVLPTFDISTQAARGLVKNPANSLPAFSLAGAPTIGALNPSVAVVQTAQAPRVIASTAFAFSDGGKAAVSVSRITPALTKIEAFSAPAKTAALTTAGAQTGGYGGYRAFSVLALPQIDAVLNEFHGGSSSSLSGKNYSYYSALPLKPIMPSAQNGYIHFSDYYPSAVYSEPSEAETKIGFDELDSFASKLLKKRSNSKSNRARYNNFMAIARYCSPRLITELLEIIDQNPHGYKTFDILYEKISALSSTLKAGQIITLSNTKKHLTAIDFTDDQSFSNYIFVSDNPLEDAFNYLAASGNFMLESALAKALTLPRAEQHKIFANLVDLAFQSKNAALAQKAYLTAVNGSPAEWEDFSANSSIVFALGKEVKKDILKELSLKKNKLDYKRFLKEYQNWLVKVLGATREAPAFWFKNEKDTYFIYSHDGSRRIRIGGHELLLSKSVNYHFHLEYRSAADGAWIGPVNYVYAWPKQDKTPEETLSDMVKGPIQNLTNAGFLTTRENFYGIIPQKEGSSAVRILEYDYSGGIRDLGFPAKPADFTPEEPFSINFKGWEKSLIPNMTFRGLSYVPVDKELKQEFLGGIKKDLTALFGTEDFIVPWRKGLRKYDVSPYQKSTFTVVTPSYYTGSAFFTEYLGMKFLLTNKHVVGESKRVALGDSEGNVYGARVLATTFKRDGWDLALLMPYDQKIFEGREPLKLSAAPLTETGTQMYALGYPGERMKFNKKALLFVENDFSGRYPAINAVPSVIGGNSGGPLLMPTADGRDKVVGVTMSGSSVNSFFAPTVMVKNFLKETIKLGLSNPEFDNAVFYNAGLFSGHPSFRELFSLDGTYWRQSLLNRSGKNLPSFGGQTTLKMESRFLPIDFPKPNKSAQKPLSHGLEEAAKPF